MPFNIVRNDITKMKVDIVVNAANQSLLGGGGVDGAIHGAAGPDLLEECKTLGGCSTGQVKVTKAYKLPAKYIVHAVGPRWKGGNNGEEILLRSCYKKALEEAVRLACESIAFPLIASGIYGYPKDKALKVARDEIRNFLNGHELQVYLVIFDRQAMTISDQLFNKVRSFVDQRYVDRKLRGETSRLRTMKSQSARDLDRLSIQTDLVKKTKNQAGFLSKGHEPLAKKKARSSYDPIDPIEPFRPEEVAEEIIEYGKSESSKSESSKSESSKSEASKSDFRKDKRNLEDSVKGLDESFATMLLRLIDEKGFRDVIVYKRANVDRRLFSKIRKDDGYNPSKRTAIAFCIALELNLDQSKDLLKKAGYALSDSNKFDVIIQYFIQEKDYDIYTINEVLFKFEEKLLGA